MPVKIGIDIGSSTTKIVAFEEEHMLPPKESGAVRGHDIPYLLTGRLNQHPSAAIDYIKSGETHYADFYTDLLDK